MVVAEEAVIGRKWRRMCGFENEVLGLVDESLFGAGVASPKDENEVWASGVEIFNNGGSESFPTVAAV